MKFKGADGSNQPGHRKNINSMHHMLGAENLDDGENDNSRNMMIMG